MPTTSLIAVSTGAALLVAYLCWRRRWGLRPRPLTGVGCTGAADPCTQTPAPPHTIIISLARLKAQRAAALSRASDAGLTSVSIFDAVDGRELSAAELERRDVATYTGWRLAGSGFRFFDRELKWGEVGCALSHLGVWSAIAARADGDVALVLEDDVDFAPSFAEALLGVLNEVSALVDARVIEAPDAIYLGRRAMRPEHDRLLPRASECANSSAAAAAAAHARPVCRNRLVAPGFSYKTTAYLLWPSGARKLLASGFARKLIPVDDFLALTYSARHEAKAGVGRPDLDALFADAPRLNMLAVRPQLCWERRGISTTENSRFITE